MPAGPAICSAKRINSSSSLQVSSCSPHLASIFLFLDLLFTIYHWPKAPVSSILKRNDIPLSGAPRQLRRKEVKVPPLDIEPGLGNSLLVSSPLPPRHCPFTLFICLRTHFGLSFATWEEAFDEQ
ncbi:hypothetical protein V2G26_006604 [Clonostachys chloroleuca]